MFDGGDLAALSISAHVLVERKISNVAGRPSLPSMHYRDSEADLETQTQGVVKKTVDQATTLV
jgi:hypothetical protein